MSKFYIEENLPNIIFFNKDFLTWHFSFYFIYLKSNILDTVFPPPNFTIRNFGQEIVQKIYINIKIVKILKKIKEKKIYFFKYNIIYKV